MKLLDTGPEVNHKLKDTLLVYDKSTENVLDAVNSDKLAKCVCLL